MTKKNIFAYKLILPLNISEFNLFFMWKSPPTSWKKSPLPHPLLNFWLEVQPPPQQKGGCTVCILFIIFLCKLHIIIISILSLSPEQIDEIAWFFAVDTNSWKKVDWKFFEWAWKNGCDYSVHVTRVYLQNE